MKLHYIQSSGETGTFDIISKYYGIYLSERESATWISSSTPVSKGILRKLLLMLQFKTEKKEYRTL